ncbi:centromere/kinetochore protein zw10 homolog [Hippoglossus hippoglossus]|uniref:centromere/kinetochore protein zw10 homolog n=1 Tax=Hippoglossus hippoglossus TaxID=8267 RepID=UPI00148C0551|nr:centromere/kinetochore protein zw10 homolog [Hippoglossus hippoglossus]XP_035035040.2 centromere/kinetochore protein zw10 homolog [Hippoglossus stenolepis]
MASFVTEVLASSGKLEKEDLSGKISKMSRKVEDTKEEVCDMINKRYGDFIPSLQGSEELMVQVDEVSKEMDVLKNCIENEIQQNIHVAVAEYAKLKQQLEKNTIIITMLGFIKEFHNAMEEFNKSLQEKKYVDAANQLERARTSVDSLKGWKTSQLPLLSTLSSELTVQRENLIYHMGDEWKRLVIWRLPSSKESAGLKSFLKVELKLSHPGSKEGEPKPPALLCCVLQALAIQGDLQHKIKLFSQVLLKNMLKPLVVYPSLSVKVTEQQGEGTFLALECLEESPEERSTPSQVYRKLLLVLQTLHSHLLDVSIGDKKLSTILGELIWEEISQCIIHECLLYSIPTNNSQLEKYKSVIKETEEFEKSLKEMEFLQGDSTDLLKYARDVNCHFASKKCKDVIVAARKLMTSKMHNTVKITPDSKLRLPKLPAPSSELKVKQEATKEDITMENPKQLSAWSLCLPACRISESVQQLMELTLNTLCEAVGSSTQCALQLFFTVRNIFQLFYDVVPTYHKENLLKFPHLAAIQHNNCMYLAHHLLTLGHHFRGHLPQPLSEGVATFVDMVPGFRKLGAQCFLAQLNVQRAELLERLSTAHNFCNLDDEDNYIAASKAVRQVIHQLKQLGTVWQDVLPVSIYCKAMGNLLNTAITEVIAKIMMLEDISSEDGEHLHTLCQTIIEEGPLVFIPLAEENKNKRYQEEVPLYVKKWSTFKELVIVLRANLQEIVDRWADGKGPLALEFSSSEGKNLIRALFQNTERRAVALTKIK